MSEFGPQRFEIGTAMLMAGLRIRHEFAGAAQGIALQWDRFFAMGDVPDRLGPACYGIMCGADPTGFEYMCGVEVRSFSHLPSEWGRLRVPPQEYAVFAHPGSSSELASTWRMILEWLSSGEFESAHQPDFEIYEAGIDPRSAMDGVEIWVGVRPRN